ncbi:MAG: GAF domain-containing protein [Chloroflexia bacterium]
MNRAASELSPQEEELLLEVGQRLWALLPALTARWATALDDLLAAGEVGAAVDLRQEALSAAHALLQALSEGRPAVGWESGRTYGEEMALHGLSRDLLEGWLSILRQSLLTALTQVYADDPRLDQAIVALSKFLALYLLRVTGSFGDRQQRLLLEQQEALRRTYEEAQRRVVELEVLNEIGQAISSTMELEELLELIYQQTSRLMDTTNFYIALCDWETRTLHFEIDQEDGVRQPRSTLSVEQGLTGYIARSSRPLLFPYGPDEFLREQGIARVGRPSKSWLGVPMLFRERVVGVIAVQSYTREGAYDEGHLRILSTIASQAAVAVQNARLYREARRRAEEMEALYRIGAASAGRLSLEEILQSIYEQAGVVMDTSGFYVALYDPREEVISFELVYDRGQRLPPFRAEKGGLTGWVLDRRETLLIRDWEKEATEELRRIAIPLGEPVRSWLGVPMLARGEAIGVIAAQSYQPEAFDEHHRQVLEMIAHQAAAAIESARLYQEAQRRLQEVDTLLEVGRSLSPMLDLEQLLPSVLEAAIRTIPPAERGSVFLPDESGELVIAAQQGYAPEVVEQVRLRPGEGFAGWVFQEGRSDIVVDPRQDPRFKDAPASIEIRSMMAAPLVGREGVIGVISLDNCSQTWAFSPSDLRLLDGLAQQVSIALENARLYQEARRRVAQLSALQAVGLKLASTQNLSEILEAIADSALELLRPSSVLIFLYDAVRNEFTLGTGANASGERGLLAPMPRKNGLTASVARSGKMMVVEDVPHHPLYAHEREQIGELRSLASVPLVRAGEVVGVLNVAYLVPHHFTAEELALLQTFADQAAVAVANAHMFRQMQKLLQELQETTEAQSRLLHLIQELATPVVPLQEGVLLMPLVGSIDSARGRQILERLMGEVERERAQVVLVDITGVPVVDTAVAQMLLQAVQAVRLLGGETVLVGIRPEVAQTLVGLGVDLRGIVTRASLREGLAYALGRVGRRRRPAAPPSLPFRPSGPERKV